MITVGSILFIDTNILLIASDESRDKHDLARRIFNRILKAGYHSAVCGQVIREYLVVSTRPESVNGLGMKSADALHNIAQFKRKIHCYDETALASDLLQHLVLRYDLKGKRIHDANLAAVMKTQGIETIITENSGDFACFEEIRTLNLSELNSLL